MVTTGLNEGLKTIPERLRHHLSGPVSRTHLEQGPS